MPGGRPSKYKKEFAKQAEKLCAAGFTDLELADFFEVSHQTIDNWKHNHEEFLGSLKSGKSSADDRVERSLYHKAVGYTYDSVKIFMPSGSDAPVYAPYREHVPPDTTACIYWLKNRRPEDWQDKSKIDVNVTGSLADRLAASKARADRDAS
jgi:hypothetical protein